MTIAEKIAERLVHARKKNGLSAIELGKKTGITKARISHWETAKRKPGLEDAEKLSSALNISTAYLLCLTDEEESTVSFKLPIFEISNDELVPIKDLYINSSSLIDLSQKDELIAIKLTERSMEPNFRKGDVVIFNKINEAQHSDHILLKTASGIFFRKLCIDSSDIDNPTFCFNPENNEWPAISTTNQNAFSILGKLNDNLRVFI